MNLSAAICSMCCYGNHLINWFGCLQLYKCMMHAATIVLLAKAGAIHLHVCVWGGWGGGGAVACRHVCSELDKC